MTNKIVGKAVFAVGVGLENFLGTLFLSEPKEKRFYLGDFSFFPKEEHWGSRVLQRCCQTLVANKQMRRERRYDVTIHVYSGDRCIGVVGRADLRPTDEILTYPMASDEIPPATIQAGNINFLSTADSKDILAASVGEILDVYVETPNREPAHWAISQYLEYGAEHNVYSDGEHFGVLCHDDLPSFDQDWAESYFAEIADGSGEFFGEDRESELEEGSPFTTEEIEVLRANWRSNLVGSSGEITDDLRAYSIVSHTRQDGAQFASIWELSGYSFDDFQASFINLFQSRSDAIDYLETQGEIIVR